MKNFGKQLHRLITVCNKTEETYRKAADATDSSELRNKFLEIADKRQQLASELESYISTNSIVHPEDHNDLVGSLHRAWMGLKAALASSGERGIIEKCRDIDQTALDVYDDVLQGEILYSNLKPVIVSQRTIISMDFLDIDRKYFEHFPPASNEF